jgi:hypothetical protein
MEIHEGTSSVKEAKLYLLKGNFSEFTMKKDESIAEMFNRLNDIVNDLKGLGFEVPDADFNHKFLRCLPERYDTIVTLLVRSNVKTATPTQILGEVLTHDMFKKSQDEAHGGEIDMKKRSMAFKAQDSKKEEESECQEEESEEEMALFVKRFNRMMSKRNFGKKGQSSRKNPFMDKTCFQCGEMGHISVNCSNKKDDKNKKDKKNDEKKKKKFIKKKKNGQAYFMMMMMMTSHPRELPGSPSRRLHLSSPHHIALWHRVVQRYNKMMNLMNFHMMILLKCSMMPMNS